MTVETPQANFTMLPNELVAQMHKMDTVGELKVILYIVRHTLGFHDKTKRITLDEFAHGRKYRDGTRMDNGVGLSINTIRDGLRRAEEHGFITVEKDDSDAARAKHYYSLSLSDCQELTPRVAEVDNRTEIEIPLDTVIQTSVSFPSEKKQSAAPTAEVEYVDLEAEDLHEEKLRLARLAGDGVPAPDLGKRPRVKAHPKRKVTEHTRMVRALQQAFKFPGKMTQSQRGRLNKLAPLILMNGYTLEQVRDVGSIWWTTWPGNEGSPPSNDQFLQRLEQDSQRRAKTRVFTS